MTHNYKGALDDCNTPYTIWKPNEDFKRHAIPDKHIEAIRAALQLAQEAEGLRKELNSAKDAIELRTTCYDQLIKSCRENEQLRKERDELAKTVLEAKDRFMFASDKIMFSTEFAGQINLAKKVNENGNA